MPPHEIQAVLSAEPRAAHRYLELHIERLEEGLERQRQSLWEIERFLTDRPRAIA